MEFWALGFEFPRAPRRAVHLAIPPALRHPTSHPPAPRRPTQVRHLAACGVRLAIGTSTSAAAFAAKRHALGTLAELIPVIVTGDQASALCFCFFCFFSYFSVIFGLFWYFLVVFGNLLLCSFVTFCNFYKFW